VAAAEGTPVSGTSRSGCGHRRRHERPPPPGIPATSASAEVSPRLGRRVSRQSSGPSGAADSMRAGGRRDGRNRSPSCLPSASICRHGAPMALTLMGPRTWESPASTAARPAGTTPRSSPGPCVPKPSWSDRDPESRPSLQGERVRRRPLDGTAHRHRPTASRRHGPASGLPCGRPGAAREVRDAVHPQAGLLLETAGPTARWPGSRHCRPWRTSIRDRALVHPAGRRLGGWQASAHGPSGTGQAGNRSLTTPRRRRGHGASEGERGCRST
jgi:hypothetical protein